jgi:hypothetical protein
MGRVECFTIEGVRCWFWPDDHGVPHFNAKKAGQWYYKVYFLQSRDQMLVEAASGLRNRMSRGHREAICEEAESHRAELLREWESKVQHDN